MPNLNIEYCVKADKIISLNYEEIVEWSPKKNPPRKNQPKGKQPPKKNPLKKGGQRPSKRKLPPKPRFGKI